MNTSIQGTRELFLMASTLEGSTAVVLGCRELGCDDIVTGIVAYTFGPIVRSVQVHVDIKYLCKLYSELGTFGPPQCRLF